MPYETWFPSVIFYEDVLVDPVIRQGVLEAVAERAEAHFRENDTNIGMTAFNIINDFHLDPRVIPLLELFRPPIRSFLYDVMMFDREQVEFYIGRCWPVVQNSETPIGAMHHHGGAKFSVVFYLQSPEGSGALEFHKPFDAPHDVFEKTKECDLTYRVATYQAVENRLIVFSSSIRHRRLPNSETSTGERSAIAFDLYSMVAIDASGAGMPRQEFLRKFV